MKYSHPLAAFALLAALSPAAFAQMAAPPAQEFVTKAATSDMVEIESSKVALKNAKSEDVKTFAQQMIVDHTKASQGLVAAADQSGEKLEIPALLDKPHSEKLEKLNAASGDAFDKLYLDEQVAGHKDALELMTAYSEGGDQEALKAHAAKTKPVVQMHYEHVQELDKKMM